jgi:hypothetical protein
MGSRRRDSGGTARHGNLGGGGLLSSLTLLRGGGTCTQGRPIGQGIWVLSVGRRS